MADADRNTSPASKSLVKAARGSSDADASKGREDVRGVRAVDEGKTQGGGCGGGEQQGSFLKDKIEGMKVSESPAAGGSGSEDHEFECTVCLDDVRTLEGFIWQCRGGHVFCSKCYEQVGGDGAPCPTCKVPLSNIRNRLAEKQRERLKKVKEKR